MTSQVDPVLVCGAGGFIGGHLVRALITGGASNVRAVDVKPLEEWYQVSPESDSHQLDLKDLSNCRQATAGMSLVYQLAADMGGMGSLKTTKLYAC